MSGQVLYTIQKVGTNRKQKVYANEWNNHEAVWQSQLYWYIDGEFIVTNTETGESKTFVRQLSGRKEYE